MSTSDAQNDKGATCLELVAASCDASSAHKHLIGYARKKSLVDPCKTGKMEQTKQQAGLICKYWAAACCETLRTNGYVPLVPNLCRLTLPGGRSTR